MVVNGEHEDAIELLYFKQNFKLHNNVDITMYRKIKHLSDKTDTLEHVSYANIIV